MRYQSTHRLERPNPGSIATLAIFTLAALLLFAGGTIAQGTGDGLTGLILDQPPAFSEPVEAERYLVRPGDTLIVTFIDAQLSARRFVVTVDGSIVDQVLGRIPAGGQMLSDVRERLGERLSAAYRVDDFDISIAGPLRLAVSVSGQVANPGVYGAYTSQRVSEVLALAGGLSSNASRRNIMLISPADTVMVDLSTAFELGDSRANPFLAAGAQVHVPRRSSNVIAIQGEVRRPTEVEFKPTDSINHLLMFAGGPADWADLDNLLIIRDGERLAISETQLQSGDVLYVPRDDAFVETVMLFGAVTSPGRYRWSDGLTVAQLLSRAGDPTDQAVQSRTTIFRRVIGGDRGERRFPVEVSPKDQGVVLQPMDSVVVPNELGYVQVTGLVRNPGYFPHQSDKSVRFYINAAGGFLPDAEQNRVTLTNRVSGLSSQVDPAVVVHDGDRISVMAREELR